MMSSRYTFSLEELEECELNQACILIIKNSKYN